MASGVDGRPPCFDADHFARQIVEPSATLATIVSPRRYEMANRGIAVESTRKRIVDAAVRLHAARGTASTTWDDIAEAAHVSRATVYHHFSSLDQLVPACAQAAFDMIDVPTPEEATALFARHDSPRARLGHFIRESCRCYAAGAAWLRAAWRERDLVAPMGSAVRRLQAALRILLAAALEGAELDAGGREVVSVLVDFPFWDALHRAGVPHDQIPARILKLALLELKPRRTR